MWNILVLKLYKIATAVIPYPVTTTLHCVDTQGEVHPTIATLGRKYASGEVTGATARAVAMLVAFKHVVMDYSTPPDKVY